MYIVAVFSNTFQISLIDAAHFDAFNEFHLSPSSEYSPVLCVWDFIAHIRTVFHGTVDIMPRRLDSIPI
jgi:hypothetical protein